METGELEQQLELIVKGTPWVLESCGHRQDELSGISEENIDELRYRNDCVEVESMYASGILDSESPADLVVEIAQRMLGTRKTIAFFHAVDDGWKEDVTAVKGQIALAMQMDLLPGDLYCELAIKPEKLIHILSREEEPVYGTLQQHMDFSKITVSLQHDTPVEDFLKVVSGFVNKAAAILRVTYGIKLA